MNPNDLFIYAARYDNEDYARGDLETFLGDCIRRESSESMTRRF